MSVIRAFIAIELPEELQTILGKVSRELAEDVPHGSVRWVKPQNIHLTLRFLGEVRHDKLQAIYRGTDDIAVSASPFSLYLDAIGCFPNPRRPRVIWIGLTGDLDQLGALHRSVEQMLFPLGWEKERRKFHPHLTLGRVKDSNRIANAGLPWGRSVVEGKLNVDAVHLVESQLFPTGAVYHSRHIGMLGRTQV